MVEASHLPAGEQNDLGEDELGFRDDLLATVSPPKE
jgi:hypothetical protein